MDFKITDCGEKQYEIKTVSLSQDTILSIGGLSVLPDYDMKSVTNDYEALILIGGMSWRNENTRQMKPFVEIATTKGKYWEAFVMHQLF